jgi:hypothetical protein
LKGNSGYVTIAFFYGVKMEQSAWDTFFWIACGALSYNILSNVLGLARSIVLVKDAMFSCLKILSSSSENLKEVNRIKYMKLKETGVSQKEIDAIESLDQVAIENWQNATYYNMILNCPKQIRRSLGFDDWDSAIRSLNKRGQ